MRKSTYERPLEKAVSEKLVKPLGFEQVSGDLPEDLLTPVEDFGGVPEKEKPKAFRFGTLPDWKFPGWQFVLFFGSITDPTVPAVLQLGWKTLILGAFKVAGLPEEGKEIGPENVRGTIVQFQVWLPFDRFGKL